LWAASVAQFTKIRIRAIRLEFGELRYRFFQNRNLRIGVIPERQEILIGCLSLSFLPGERVRTPRFQMGQSAGDAVPDDAGAVQDFLKLRRGPSLRSYIELMCYFSRSPARSRKAKALRKYSRARVGWPRLPYMIPTPSMAVAKLGSRSMAR